MTGELQNRGWCEVGKGALGAKTGSRHLLYSCSTVPGKVLFPTGRSEMQEKEVRPRKVALCLARDCS